MHGLNTGAARNDSPPVLDTVDHLRNVNAGERVALTGSKRAAGIRLLGFKYKIDVHISFSARPRAQFFAK